MGVWVAEIKMRASRQIGEMSLVLDKVVTTGGGKVGIPSGRNPKRNTPRIHGAIRSEREK